MKTFYTLLITLLTATGLHAQTQSIPAPATNNGMEKSSFSAQSSNADDSLLSHVQVLPNLAMGRITVVVADANVNVIQQGECVIFNNAGAPVAKSPFTTGANQIYVSTLSTGMYFVKLMQKNGQSVTRKFAVVR